MATRQSKEVFGEVSTWAVYHSLGQPRGGYRESRAVYV